MVPMAGTTATGIRKIETYEEFAKVHALLLPASGLPEQLHRRHFEKLSGEHFDGGDHFQVQPCEDGCQRRLVLMLASMPRDSDVFLVDHAWTIKLSEVYKQLNGWIHTLRVRKMIRSVFEAAAVTHPEMHSPTSRTMYGVDVMLDSSFQPKLLEVCQRSNGPFLMLLSIPKVTYCPDCTRACKYDMDIVVGEGGVAKASDFFNNVFRCLFLNEISQVSPL